MLTINEYMASDVAPETLSNKDLNWLAQGAKAFSWSATGRRLPENWEQQEERRMAVVAEFNARLALQTQPTPVIVRRPEVLCTCGHYSTHPMSTSRGTACDSDCYDRMSD